MIPRNMRGSDQCMIENMNGLLHRDLMPGNKFLL